MLQLCLLKKKKQKAKITKNSKMIFLPKSAYKFDGQYHIFGEFISSNREIVKFNTIIMRVAFSGVTTGH